LLLPEQEKTAKEEVRGIIDRKSSHVNEEDTQQRSGQGFS
jgi:hypothetical protein